MGTGHSSLVNEVRSSADATDADGVLRATIDGLPDAALVVDGNWRVICCNAAAARLVGQPAEKLTGRPLELFFGVETTQGLVEELRQSASGGRLSLADVVLRRPRRPEVHAHYTIAPILHDATPARARQLHLLGEIKPPPDERRQAQELLPIDVLGQLATNIAHDVNNALAVVIGNSEWLKDITGAGGEARDAIRGIEQAVAQARGVTRSLGILGVTSGSGRQRPTGDLCRAVRDGIGAFRQLLPANVRPIVDTSCQPPPRVAIPLVELYRILLLMVVATRERLRHGGTLHVAVHRDDDRDRALLVISDTGRRTDDAGLAPIRKLLQPHRGRVETTAKKGNGRAFTITLPLSEGTNLVPRTKPAAPRGQGELLLLAESDGYVREMIATELVSVGYEVLPARDKRSFLRGCRQEGERLRLVVISADFGGGAGLQWLAQAKEEGLARQAVVLANEHVQGLGPDDVLLRKPFLLEDLGRVVWERLRGGG